MRTSTLITSGLLLLMMSSALAVPHHDISSTTTTTTAAAAATAIVEKRQVDGQADFSRPREWNDLPPLPPPVRQAYVQQIHIDALVSSHSLQPNTLLSPNTLSAILSVSFSYLSLPDIAAVLQEVLPEIEAADGSASALLARKLRELDTPTLERQMAEIVRFRRENEQRGSSGQERWRYLETRRPGDPSCLLAPFAHMTRAQDRLLVVAKVRSGVTSRRELVRYIRGQDPFLTQRVEGVGGVGGVGGVYYPDLVVRDALAHFGIELRGPWSWLGDLFGV